MQQKHSQTGFLYQLSISQQIRVVSPAGGSKIVQTGLSNREQVMVIIQESLLSTTGLH